MIQQLDMMDRKIPVHKQVLQKGGYFRAGSYSRTRGIEEKQQ